MLNKPILDNLWQSGFCRTLIDRLKHSRPGQAEAQKRVEITQHHIQMEHCRDCRYANTIRSIEGETAGRLGPSAFLLFQRGGDIRAIPGFQETFRQVMEDAIQSGLVDRGILRWLSALVPERAGKPYPYAEDDDGSQAN